MTWQLSNNVRDSVGFVFMFSMTNAEGSTARALHVPRGRKSDQFSLEPNRKHFPSQDAPWLSPVAPSVPHGSQFVVFFLYVREKPEEGDLFWIYALDSERVFAMCVLCSLPAEGGLTGFWFKLLMNDGRLGFPVSSACSCLAKQEPHEEAKTGRQSVVRRRCEGVRNNFSHAPDYAWTSFQKMGVRKLKICKFSLVCKICCFFGSLSCVFDSRWFDVWNAV